MSTELQELDELEELAKRYGKDKDSDWYHKRANLIEKKWHKVLQAQARGKAAAGVVGAAANNPVEDGKRKHYQWSTIKKLTNTTQAKAEQALLVALGVKGPLMCGRPHSGAGLHEHPYVDECVYAWVDTNMDGGHHQCMVGHRHGWVGQN